MSAKSRPSQTLAELEWNFDAIPDSEVIACCYWEYARESAFIRNLRERCLNPKWRKMLNTELDAYVGIDLEKLQSIGEPANVILRGFFTLPNASLPAGLPTQRGETFEVFRSFPDAWQSLTAQERRARSKINPENHRFNPLSRGMTIDAENILNYARIQRAQAEADRQKVRSENPSLKEETLLQLGKLKFPDIKTSVWYEYGREANIIAIEWGYFTNDEIVNYFRSWVKANRPERFPGPNRKGHKLNDWRAHLTRLAVLRLLSHFTALEIVDPRQNRCPAVWKTKAFAGDKWGDANKWYDARREAKNTFFKLFPFLSPEDLPLAWNPSSPAK